MDSGRIYSEEEKQEIIQSFILESSKNALFLFAAFDLKTHIEGKVIDDKTDAEYLFLFRKIK